MRVQAEIDAWPRSRHLGEPAAQSFYSRLHSRSTVTRRRRCCASGAAGGEFHAARRLAREAGHDMAVGQHLPPSSGRVAAFMRHFGERYRFAELGRAGRIIAMAAAHHRFNYIHPFPDGNGRVSRLMSHAMGHVAGIGAHGLWSVSRGLARGLVKPRANTNG